jgi:hypothetical protein
MTLAAMNGGGMYYPEVWPRSTLIASAAIAVSSETAMALTADRVAMLGYARIADGSASKVLSAAGGGSITWRTNGVTWANGSTTMDVGIQGVSASGPMLQPDGTYGVKRTLTGGDGNVVATSTQTTSMTGGSGTSTITNGALFAVVWDMTARAGADSVVVYGTQTSLIPCVPLMNYYTAGAWRTTGGRNTNMLITSDDGTLIGFEDGPAIATLGTVESFSDATNPDERGLLFQVPWNCKIDGLWALVGCTDANSDYTITLYSDPLGTPASMGSMAVLAEQGAQVPADRMRFFPVTPVELAANTDYVVAVRATGSTSARLQNNTLFSAASRALFPGGTTVAKATRNNGSGAFTAEATPLTMYGMGVRLSSFHVSGSEVLPKVYTA